MTLTERALIMAAVLILSVPFLIAQEKITLTTPETKPSNGEYQLDSFNSHYDDPATTLLDEGYLQIVLRGQNKELVSCTYNDSTTPTGTFLNNALNKVNASTAYAGNATTGSLKQRIYHRLVIMNEAPAVCGRSFAGALTGSVP